jgi:leader peptidase (prepilin peptidase) / N-methyltransferase
MQELIDTLVQVPWLGFTAVVVFGLLVGSFLNVVIYRLPVMMQAQWLAEAQEINASADAQNGSIGAAAQPAAAPKALEAPEAPKKFNLITPDSTCPHCGHKIRAWENIPVISWLLLRGKCSSCKAPISPRYAFVELLTGALAGLAAWHFGGSIQLAAALALTFCLVTLTFIDLDTQLLPDIITLPLMWLGLLLNLKGVFVTIESAVIGAVAGYLILWSIYWLFKLVTGKEGMGYGDFKLLAALGAWFGWQVLPMIILLSSVVGLVAAVGLMLFKNHQRSQPIPFGPYLAGAGLLALYLRPVLAGVMGIRI